MQIKWGFKIAIELTVRQKHCSLMSIHTLSLLLPLAPVAFRLLFFFFFSFVWEIMQDLGLLLFLTSKAMRRVRKLHMDHVHCWGTLLWGCSLPCSLAVTLPLQAPDFPLWWSLCLFHNSLFFPVTVASPLRSLIFTRDRSCATQAPKANMQVWEGVGAGKMWSWERKTRGGPHPLTSFGSWGGMAALLQKAPQSFRMVRIQRWHYLGPSPLLL